MSDVVKWPCRRKLNCFSCFEKAEQQKCPLEDSLCLSIVLMEDLIMAEARVKRFAQSNYLLTQLVFVEMVT